MEENKEVAMTPQEVEAKKWYHSRTLWVNVIMAVAVIIQTATGHEVIDTEAQTGLLAFINILLRIVTKVPLV